MKEGFTGERKTQIVLNFQFRLIEFSSRNSEYYICIYKKRQFRLIELNSRNSEFYICIYKKTQLPPSSWTECDRGPSHYHMTSSIGTLQKMHENRQLGLKNDVIHHKRKIILTDIVHLRASSRAEIAN